MIYREISDSVIDIINRSAAEFLTLQYEQLENVKKSIQIAKKFKGHIGLAITVKTDIDVIAEFVNNINYVMVMCSEPGITGAKFDNRSFNVVERLRENYPNLKIHVDGGIEANISKKMNNLGVHLIVSGSYLAKNIDDLNSHIYKLKYSGEETISVKRNMIKLQKLPLVNINAEYLELMDIINRYKFGMCFVTDNDKFLGIITDGDLRRAALKYKEKIFSIKSLEIMNKNPFVVDESATLKDVGKSIFETGKWYVKVVPIIQNGILIGAINI